MDCRHRSREPDQEAVVDVVALRRGGRLMPVAWKAGLIHCWFELDEQVLMRLAERLGSNPSETLRDFAASS